VLGETARTDVVFTGGGSVRKIFEQVSHHPPVSAFHCEAEGGGLGVTSPAA
jgi:hypothetical protein